MPPEKVKKSSSRRGMVEIVVLLAVLLAAAFVAGYFYLVNEKKATLLLPGRATPPSSEARAHFYNDPETSIAKIGLWVFYVVPKNKAEDFDKEWRERIDSALEKAARFHSLQLRGLSRLDYKIFPTPVFLERNDIFYNSTSTDRGNPRGLIAIAEEVDRRVFRPTGDLYDPNFVKQEADVYPVMGLVYEGVGASGGVIYETQENLTREEIAKKLGVPESIIYIVDVESVRGFFLLNYEFLKKKALSLFGPTYLYHEFGHSFGLPDRDDGGELPPANDIMGYGRKEPLDVMYIGEDLLKGLGVM